MVGRSRNTVGILGNSASLHLLNVEKHIQLDTFRIIHISAGIGAGYYLTPKALCLLDGQDGLQMPFLYPKDQEEAMYSICNMVFVFCALIRMVRMEFSEMERKVQ